MALKEPEGFIKRNKGIIGLIILGVIVVAALTLWWGPTP